MFHRLMTGIQIANYRNEPMRFMTLTSSKQGKLYIAEGDVVKTRTIKESWSLLKKWIKREFGWNLNKYICFRTSEGNGVLHVVFWGGRFIPQAWLSNAWKEIHNAEVVDIRFVHNIKKSLKGLVGYLLDRYLLNQPIERMSYGWGWAWLGFCKSWEVVKETYNGMWKGQYSYNEKGELVYDQAQGYVPFKKRISNKCVSAWKSILGNHRVTSRQALLPKYLSL